jgi:hypothetical protein
MDFILKIHASNVADYFCGLRNDKYIKFQLGENCGLRAFTKFWGKIRDVMYYTGQS